MVALSSSDELFEWSIPAEVQTEGGRDRKRAMFCKRALTDGGGRSAGEPLDSDNNSLFTSVQGKFD